MAIVALRWFVKPGLSRRTFAELAQQRHYLNHLTDRLHFPKHLRRRSLILGGVPCESTFLEENASSHGENAEDVVLYLHGGAFVVGSPRMYRDLTFHLAQACKLEVIAVDYRLSPEHPHPYASEDALASYLALRELRPQAKIFLAGDSAGGNLVASTLLRVRDLGINPPTAAILLSPWLDLTGSGDSMRSLAARDPMLPATRIHEVAAAHANGHDLKHPYLSPLFGDLRGLPPMLLQVGSEEVLLDDARRLAAQAPPGQVRCEVWTGLWHVFQAFARFVPEARNALAQIAAYTQQYR